MGSALVGEGLVEVLHTHLCVLKKPLKSEGGRVGAVVGESQTWV